jgi:hypothetical protein
MTSKEFTIWLKGVIVGAAKFQPTSEQWKAIRDQVELIDDNPVKTSLVGNTGTATTQGAITQQFPYNVVSSTSYVTGYPSGSTINYTTL